jgi:imidazolonepropionase-like amidohydrolase
MSTPSERTLRSGTASGFRLRASGLALLVATAATASMSLDAQEKVVVLRAARMFDGQEIRTPGVVVVAGSRIRAAGPTVAVPAGAPVIELGDATLSPGFIDAHTHLSSMFVVDYKQAIIDGLRQAIPEQTLRATENLRKTVMAGVTTVRDVGSSDFIDVGLRNASAEGLIPGPRMLVSVHSLSATGGHCDDQNGMRAGVFGPENGIEKGVINSPDEGRRAVRYNIKYGADVIKVCATGGVLSLTDPPDVAQLTQEELNAIVDEAHTLRKKTAAHAHGAEGAKRAIRAGIDSIEHGAFLDDDAIDMMKARGTYYVPTLMAIEGGKLVLDQGGYAPLVAEKMRASIASLDNVVKKAIARGVKIGVGTDAAVYPHGRNTEEYHLLVDLGMSPLDALRAGTAVNAELLGMKGQIGTLAEGAFADVVAIPGDPRQNIRQVERVFFVMKEGIVLRQDRPAK